MVSVSEPYLPERVNLSQLPLARRGCESRSPLDFRKRQLELGASMLRCDDTFWVVAATVRAGVG